MAEIKKEDSKESPSEKFRRFTKTPSIADELLEPVRQGIYRIVDEKVKPRLLAPGDFSGTRYLYIDKRIDPKNLDP